MKLRMRQAIAAALADEMRADESVIVIGEDVAAAGGVFKATEGLLAEFGPARVRDTPISEMGFLGAAVGAAATGLRPVVEIMFMEFLGVALDQLVTQAAKYHYLSGGRLSVPLVLRGSVGSGLGFGAQHSQTLEHWFTATPGLTLAVASTPANAYGLLRSAIRDDNPVVLLEPRACYGDRGEVDRSDSGVVPLGVAQLAAAGEDVTIVGLGRTAGVAQRAADAATGRWSAEVIDLQTLIPWDRRAVLGSVGRTRRLVIVEENPYAGGWGADIAAEVSGRLFGELAAPVLRVTCPDVPVPFQRDLERDWSPGPEVVADQIDTLLATGRLPEPWWAA
jgi:pyruvate dehydrogenase E1 component beta subunit